MITFSWVFLEGRTLIWVKDGWSQHYKALVYYSQYLRSIVKGFLSGDGWEIPLWDFSIGEGSGILETLHYYVIGDPFAALSLFVPVRYLHLFVWGIMLFRLYLAGIAFSCLCFQTGKNSPYAVMAGSFAYMFCSWGIYNVAKHPYFLNPMIYFPLMLIGIEKLFKKERPYLFVTMVFLSAISNFYFFYMIVLSAVIYVAVRLVVSYRRDVKQGVFAVLRIGTASVIGLLMSAVIFLPVCYAVLGDPRISAGNSDSFFYPLSYYSSLPGLFLLGDSLPYGLCLGYTAPVLLAVFLLFVRRNENGLLKVFFVIGIVIMLFPIFGRIFNGFSYMSNRWSWVFALVCAYILTAMWPPLVRVCVKEWIILFCCMLFYLILCAASEYSHSKGAVTALVLNMVCLIMIAPMKNGRSGVWGKQRIVFLFVLSGIFSAGFWRFSSYGNDFASKCCKMEGITDKLTRNESVAVSYAADADGVNSFYRYSGSGLTKNANMITGISSTQYYCTLSNPYVSEFRKMMEMPESITHKYDGYDDRSSLMTLASVLYYTAPSGQVSGFPYGYTNKREICVGKTTEADLSYVVCKNDYALPPGYVYDGYLSVDQWEALSSVEKQEALLRAVVLEEYQGEVKEKEVHLTSQEMKYTVECDNNKVSLLDHVFVVTSGGASATLKFHGLQNSETYLDIKGLTFEAVPAYDLYFGDESVDPGNLYGRAEWDALSDARKRSIEKKKKFWTNPDDVRLKFNTSTGVAKVLQYNTEMHSYYNNRHDFTINLNYAQEAVSTVKVTFPRTGLYCFDSIKVICQPMDRYDEDVAVLKDVVLEDVQVEKNTVSGTISLENPGLLCLAVPYSDGWTAFVDGEQAEIYHANIMYMALDLEPGDHSVRLEYQTPLLKTGRWISLMSCALSGLYVLFREKGILLTKKL